MRRVLAAVVMLVVSGLPTWADLSQSELDTVLSQGADIVVAGYPAVRPDVLSIDDNCGAPKFLDQSALLALHCATAPPL